MIRQASLLFFILSVLSPLPATFAQTDIRTKLGGDRILFVDGDDIRPAPGGKRLLFVDGNDIRPEPGGKRLLYIDQDADIRPAPGGVRIACWEGKNLRKTPSGPRIGELDGRDFLLDGQRLFAVDGPELSQVHLTAVLYQLKPELFQLTAGETEAKEKEMAENAAAEEARQKADHFPGDHPIYTHSSSTGPERKGSVVVTKQGDFYAITLKTGDEPAWQGIGIKYVNKNGDQELWAAIGPAGAVAFGLYEIKADSLAGVWYPINAAGDKSVYGFENLKGPGKLGGTYQIVSGKLPNGGVEYTGALSIEPLDQTLNSDAKCYRIKWPSGAMALAFQVGDKLAAAAGWGKDTELLRLQLNDADGLVGDFVSATGATGYYTLGK